MLSFFDGVIRKSFSQQTILALSISSSAYKNNFNTNRFVVVFHFFVCWLHFPKSKSRILELNNNNNSNEYLSANPEHFFVVC